MLEYRYTYGQVQECSKGLQRVVGHARQAPEPPRTTRRQPEPKQMSPKHTCFPQKTRLSPNFLEWDCSVGPQSKFTKKMCYLWKSVLTLAECEWRAAALGLKPLRLPRARLSMSAALRVECLLKTDIWNANQTFRTKDDDDCFYYCKK